jgi:hypothetical protein
MKREQILIRAKGQRSLFPAMKMASAAPENSQENRAFPY